MKILNSQKYKYKYKLYCDDEINDIQNCFKHNVSEIKKINWLVEFLKSIVIMLITTGTIFLIRTASKGELEGDKLKEYLAQITCERIGIPYNPQWINLNVKLECNSDSILLPQKTIISDGSYKTISQINDTNNDNIQKSLYNGRFIVIFEREEKNFFNDLFGVSPPYEVKYIRVMEGDYVYDNVFYYTDHVVTDIDKDGKTDILISYRSNFATRTGNANILLTKINNNWQAIDFNINNIFMHESKYWKNRNGYYYEENNISYYLSIEEQYISNPINKDVIEKLYFISRGSTIYKIESPIDKTTNFLLKIAAQAPNDEGAALPSWVVFICLNYKHGEITVNNKWNSGKPLLIKENNLNNFNYNDYWGYQFGGLMFY